MALETLTRHRRLAAWFVVFHGLLADRARAFAAKLWDVLLQWVTRAPLRFVAAAAIGAACSTTDPPPPHAAEVPVALAEKNAVLVASGAIAMAKPPGDRGSNAPTPLRSASMVRPRAKAQPTRAVTFDEPAVHNQFNYGAWAIDNAKRLQTRAPK